MVSRFDANAFAHFGGEFGQCGFRLVAGFRFHDLLNAQPMLKIARLDDIGHDQDSVGAAGAIGGVVCRSFAFGRVIDDHKKLAAMTLFPRQSLRNHGAECAIRIRAEQAPRVIPEGR